MSSTTTESPAAGETPTTVQEVLNSIADDIERLGHFKRPEMPYSHMYGSGKGTGPCCLICNPTNAKLSLDAWDLVNQADAEIRRRILERRGLTSLSTYSDAAPTDEVIAMLRAEQ